MASSDKEHDNGSFEGNTSLPVATGSTIPPADPTSGANNAPPPDLTLGAANALAPALDSITEPVFMDPLFCEQLR
ncbi:UNVERIFIED_CONTAM: hypothetical protein Slati_3888300 [Sesamum latifolium]|uniref:Uncharacterized protein n=1 Tax=Sesamum latifolium TaxID=2727402 RepID=A0AAW2TM89_9LAMI